MSNYDSTKSDEGGVGEAKKVIGEAGQNLKAEVQSFASVAGERMWAQADKAAQVATKTIGDLAQAVRRAGEDLASSDQRPGSKLADKAASGLQGLSGALANKRPEELLDTVRGFGRRNPALFIGGTVLMGVALGRFLRAAESGGQADGELRRAADRAGVEHDATSFTPAEDRFARPFGVDEAPAGVLHVDDGSSDPNADPATARLGT